MAERIVVALCKIVTSEPDAPLEFSGRYDKQGNPVLRKQQRHILSGTAFEMDESDGDFHKFLEGEVIRLATAAEIDAYRRASD